MTVQSALGEPLRAEIEVPEITDAEAETVVLQPASAAAFRAAGVEYSPAMAGLQLSLVRRADGRAVVRVTGARPVNDPFLEMLLEANWSGGRISRNYTVLLDPPSNRAVAAAPQIAPQVAAAPQPAVPAPAVRAVPAPLPAAAPAPIAERAPAERPPAAPRAPAVAAEPRPSAGASQVTVRPGDTAGRIAAATKPASVSLDQMLVALLQANPDAFVGNNVNRMRAGVVLDVPDAAQIAATPAPQARQIVVAQSRDFNEFRRRLAGRAPAAEVGTPQRAVTGSVQTQVEDRGATAAAPDRLTLSKGAVGTDADRIAQAGNTRDAANRSAELSKNLADLNRLGAATTPGAAPATPAITAPAVPAAPPPAPVASTPPAATPPAAATDAAAPVPAPAEPAVAAPVAPAPAPADTVTAAAPAAAPAVPPAAAAPVVEDEDGLVSLLQDSRVLAVVGLLVALVVVLASYRTIRRRRAVQDSSFLESRMQADSFFGNSGGQHVDTSSTQSVIATSYSPSQLDAGGDVDPVAEADVYLAYGRDLQAEEILKEALRIHPARTALHAKLAEIYARRPDAPAFHNIAAEAYRITDGQGDDWQRIRTLGQELDPANARYQLQPALSGAAPAVAATAAGLGAVAAVAAVADEPRAEAPPPVPVEPAEPAAFQERLTEPAAAPVMPSLDLDFSAFPSSPGAPATPAAAVAPAAEEDDFGLDFTLDDPVPADTAAAPVANPPPSPSAVDFDLDALSLDLDTPPEAPSIPDDITGSVPSPEDALATKLALAEEFAAIGDADGARHLVEEVIAEAKGSLRTRAEGMLAELD